jgi:hypothetical protein
MCFVLYAGTSRPIPRKEWCQDNPGVSVKSLTEREAPVTAHFSGSHVQYIGSTSNCGCDFPHVMFQGDGWPWFEDDQPDPQRVASDRYNREQLAALLRDSGESTIELYGIWDGDFDYSTPPVVREHVSVEQILDPCFRFKEGGFYRVHCKLQSSITG